MTRNILKYCIVLCIGSLIAVSSSAADNPYKWVCSNSKTTTNKTTTKCRLFNAEHHNKLRDAVNGVSNSARNPLIVPDGVRRSQRQVYTGTYK
jgi:hypothetical protein